MKQLTEKEALSKLMAVCARGEHCCQEMREKMMRWGIDSSAQQRIIYFKESGLAKQFLRLAVVRVALIIYLIRIVLRLQGKDAEQCKKQRQYDFLHICQI